MYTYPFNYLDVIEKSHPKNIKKIYLLLYVNDYIHLCKTWYTYPFNYLDVILKKEIPPKKN